MYGLCKYKINTEKRSVQKLFADGESEREREREREWASHEFTSNKGKTKQEQNYLTESYTDITGQTTADNKTNCIKSFTTTIYFFTKLFFTSIILCVTNSEKKNKKYDYDLPNRIGKY